MCSPKGKTTPTTRAAKPPSEQDYIARSQDAMKRRMGFAATAINTSQQPPATTGKSLLGA